MKRPLVFVALAFIAGTAAASQVGMPLLPLLGATGLFLMVAAGLLWRGVAASRVVLLGAVFLGGAWRYTWAAQRGRVEVLRPFFDAEVCLAGVVADEPRLQAERWRLTLDTHRVQLLPSRADQGKARDGGFPVEKQVYPIHSRVYVLAPNLSNVDFGDWICVTGRLRAPPAATNPGQFSYRRYLAQRGLYACLSLAPDTLPRRCDGGHGAWLPTWTVQARQALTESVERHMPGPHAQLTARLLNSIVYGLVAAPLPENIERHFRRAGVIHILVASGTQVSLLIVFLLLLRRPSLGRGIQSLSAFAEGPTTRQLGLHATLSSLLERPLGKPRLGCGYSLFVLLVIVGYTLIAGAEASIARAALMGGLLLLARVTERDCDGLTALAAAALVLLVTNPLDLFSPSFQLSFVAVLGLIRLGPLLYDRLAHRLPRPVALPLAMSSAAQLAMVPILAYEFHQVSPAGFLANVPVVPAAGLLVVTGLTASGLGLLSGTAATWLNGFNHGLLYLTMRTTCFFSELPGGFISTPGFSWWPLVLACGLLALLAVGLQGKLQFRRERWIVYGLLLLTGVVVWQAARSLNATLRVTFLDVGSGDAILIQSPAGRTMLIDGGPYQAGPPEYDAGERVVVPVLMSLGVKRLDVVVATHCQSDHIGGLPAVLREVPVGHLLVSDTDEDTDAAERLRCVAQERQVKIVSARRGQKINLGRGVHAYVLWPTERPLTGTGEDSNNNSVVLKLVYGRVSFLFTGDLEAAAERELLKRTGHLASTVLKVAHHGSKGSTTPEFLREVRPAVAVISVGTQPERGVPPPDRTNVHGHPTPTVRQRLTDAGTHLYRTDLDGAVTVCTNGRTWRVKTYGER